MQKKVWIGFAVLLALISPLYAQSKKIQWVDSVFNTLDVSGKIGQLLMLPVGSYLDEQTVDKLASQIKRQRIGGIVFTEGGPVAQAKLTNRLQQHAQVPLLIGMNAEEGLGAILDSTLRFAPPIMLGAIRDDSLLYFLGEEIGRQLKVLGTHVNFAPSSDLSTSLENETMIYGSYGAAKDLVAAKTIAYQNGLIHSGILPVTKHYADNGMRVQGFQKGVPVVLTQSDPNTIWPLQKLFENGSVGVVTAYEHDLIFPDKKNIFISKQTVVSTAIPTLYSGDYLKRQLNFKGLAFSFIPDIQEMNKKFKPGDAEVFSFKAGNDVLLFPKNINATVRKMRRAVRKDKALQNQLDEKVKKILAAKFDAGLNEKKEVNTENLISRLNTPAAQMLQSVLLERSVTVVRDDQQLLPVKQLENLSFASLSIGEKKENDFAFTLSKCVPFKHYQLLFPGDTTGLIQNLQQHDVIVVAVHPNIAGVQREYPVILQKLNPKARIIVAVFGSPAMISLVDNFPTIIEAYTNDIMVQKIVAEQIFGARQADGTLPVSINEKIKPGQGIATVALDRMGYSIPEAQGMDASTLTRIAPIAREAIEQKAAPGCQVLVARHGKIVYENNVGALTYDNNAPVNDQTIYDLASVSKVAGTLQAVMFLQERGLIDIYKKASVYLPELSNTNKKDIILKDILTHQAGLTPFLLMWPQTASGDTLLPYYYSTVQSEHYPLHVAPALYASRVIQDSVWQWLLNSPMLTKPPRTPYTPRYSDLGFMILHKLVERLVNQPMEDFLSQNLYEPLGSGTMGYLPLTHFPSSQIAPTEIDTIFRKATVTGTVHDERAAMLGGVAGHAGLFGSAIDLMKLCQMFLQKGSYGGQIFYKPETIELFAQKQFENSTRGLGWAKPGDPNSPSSRLVSPKGFGHTGFTGTCIWIDPEFDLVFIFLSNSRFPNRSSKLNSTNIRSRIQDVVYQSIFNYSQYGDLPHGRLMRYLSKTTNLTWNRSK